MNNDNDNFTKNICRVLDQSLDDLDAVTENKVSRLKYRALDSATQKKSWKFIWAGVPMTAVLLLMVLFNMPDTQQSQIVLQDVAEFNILTDTEPLDFYAEDIEFYEWLSEIMENELELSGQHTAVPVNSGSDCAFSARTRRDILTQSGTYRVSGSIRG
ncbi:MAG: hypothetical protein QM483_14390 [Desulfuromusa sp.]